MSRLGRSAGRIAAVVALAAAALLPRSGAAQCPSFSSLEVIFEEPFEDANLGARDWYDNTAMALSTVEHLPTRASAAEFRFLPGATTPTFGGGIRHLFTGTDRAYLGYWLKYSANWPGSNRPYHPHEFHFVTDLDSPWVGGA